ncbi:MAG: hypothetical protein V3S97_02745 [Candidatus Bathyarchaeia archaeon]
MGDKPKLASSSQRHRLNPLIAIKRILFPKEELLKYDLSKTAVELARLANEIKGYISDLETDFGKQDIESRTFDYGEMEPENRFVTEVLRKKKLFMEKYDRCSELFNNDILVQYGREKEETIRCGRNLLKEIEATTNKLPLSAGSMGL